MDRGDSLAAAPDQPIFAENQRRFVVDLIGGLLGMLVLAALDRENQSRVPARDGGTTLAHR